MLFTPKNTDSSHSSRSSEDSFFKSRVQTKLAIGSPGDRYEVEADNTADKVVSRLKEPKPSGAEKPAFFSPKPAVQSKKQETVQQKEEGDQDQEIQENLSAEQAGPLTESITPLVQTKLLPDEPVQEKCADCEEKATADPGAVQQKCDKCAAAEEKKPVQAKCADCEAKEKEANDTGQPVQQKCDKCAAEEEKAVQHKKESSTNSGDISQQLSASKGGGSPMDKTTQSEMSSGFGADFSNVRVHTDSNAVQMNKALGSHAFTNGNDVYFNSGKYNPSSDSGKHLLAHELTHTVQQGASGKSIAKKEDGDKEEITPLQSKSTTETIQKADDPCAPPEQGSEQQAESAETAESNPSCKTPAGMGSEQPPEGQEEPEGEDTAREIEANEGGPVDERQSNAPPPDEGAPEGQEEGGVRDGIQQEADAMMGPCEMREQKAAGGAVAAGAGAAIPQGLEPVQQPPAPVNTSEPGQAKSLATEGGEQNAGSSDKGDKKKGKEGDFVGDVAAKGVSPVLQPEGLGEMASPELLTERDGLQQQAIATQEGINLTQGRIGSLASGSTEFIRPLRGSEKKFANHAKSSAIASAFIANGASKAQGMLANGLNLATGLRGAVETNKAQLMADIAIKRQLTSGYFGQAKLNVQAKATGVKTALQVQHTTTILQIEAAAAMATAQLDMQHVVKSTELQAAYETQLAALIPAYMKGYADIIAAGDRKGNDAVTRAGVKAAAYRRGEGGSAEEQRLVVNEEADGFWDGYLTYNRFMARADAAEEVGKQYKEGMAEQAKSKADLMMCGQPKDAEFLASIHEQGNKTLECALLNSKDAINEQKQAALLQAQAVLQEMLTNIDAATLATTNQLEEKEALQLQLISDYGARQWMALERDGERAVTSALSGVNEAVIQLVSFLEQYKQRVISTTAPKAEAFAAQQQMLEADFNEVVVITEGAIGDTILQGNLTMSESGLNALLALQQLHDQGIAAGMDLTREYEASMDALLAGGLNAYSVILTNTTQGITSEQQAGIEILTGVVAGTTGLLTKIGTSVGDRFKETVEQMEKGMQDTLDKDLDMKICNQAETAAADVQPWWKTALKILLVVIVIVVVLVVAPALIAAIGPAIAGLAGSVGIGAAAAGWITTAVVGAVLGGISGAVIQIGNNLVDIAGTDKELSFDNIMKGAWGAFVSGFIGGAFGGIGGKFAQVLVGRFGSALGPIWSKATELGVDLVFDAVGTVLGDLAAGNPFSWEGLIQGMAMSFVIGKVTNKMSPMLGSILPAPKIDVDVNAPKTGTDAPKTDTGTPKTSSNVDAPKTDTGTPKTGTGVDAPKTDTGTPKTGTDVDAPKTDTGTPKTGTDVDAPKTDTNAPKTNEPNTKTGTEEPDPSAAKNKQEQFQNDENVVSSKKSSDGHDLKVDKEGVIAKCSECKVYELTHKKTLDADSELSSELATLRKKMTQEIDANGKVSDATMKELDAFDQKIAEIERIETTWPPSKPTGKKPKVGEEGAALWRYQRYRYNKFKKGAVATDVQDYATYRKQSYEAVVSGNRPGRMGGKEQVAAKEQLKSKGIRIVENVPLGKHFPDGIDPVPNPKGGIDYYEVGKMNKNGTPESREYKKIKNEVVAMGPNDRVIFVDKMDINNRVIYESPIVKTTEVETPNTKKGGSANQDAITVDKPEVEIKTKETNFQNNEGVVSKTKTADGHELKVDGDGNIAKCSECKLFEVSHKQILESDVDIQNDLKAIRKKMSDEINADGEVSQKTLQELEAFDQKMQKAETLSKDPQTGETNQKSIDETTAILKLEEAGGVINPRRPILSKGEPNLDFKVEGPQPYNWADVKTPVNRGDLTKQAQGIGKKIVLQKAGSNDVLHVVDLKNIPSKEKATFMNDVIQSAGSSKGIVFINN